MKTLVRSVTLTALAHMFVVIGSASAQTAPGLEASAPHWGPSGTVSVRSHDSPVDRGRAANYPPADEASALFRNTGRKAVKSVTWSYVFYKDERRAEVLASYEFSSGKRIEPGASVRLKEFVTALSRPRRWTEYQGVLVSRIKYADGTVWRAAGDDR